MNSQRIWMPWTAPCLPQAMAWIIDHGLANGNTCDLSDVVCITPGRRAGRQLLHLLAQRSGELSLAFSPPRMMTPGDLPGSLTNSQRPMAMVSERRLAWMEALHRCDDATKAVLFSDSINVHDFVDGHQLADQFMTLHNDIASQRISFGKVARQIEE
ncbi:MAG: hypothetical protein O7G85_05240, partial [Planctomycetota bacterium]|nr:hypothetical protein [Planctomycetota bacterium]